METVNATRLAPTPVVRAIWQACRSRLPNRVPLVSLPVSAIALIMATPAMAQISCVQAPGSCTIEESQGGEGTQAKVAYTGGGGYTLENKAALGPDTPAIMVEINGVSGRDDGQDGSNAGSVTILSSGQVNAVGSTTQPYAANNPGAFDDAGVQWGIFGASAGGNGASADNTVFGGGDGGRGGHGNLVSITNNGRVQLTSSSGGAAIFGGSIGGKGGNQDDAPTGNQKGGDGGWSGAVLITNTGDVVFDSNTVQNYAWGIAAESFGRDGGANNGAGGTSGAMTTSYQTSIINGGNVRVTAEGSALTQGVRGLSVYVQGGNGRASNDGDDDGGNGGDNYAAVIENSGTVDVRSRSVGEPGEPQALSGGVVLIAQGGDGGSGPNIFSNMTGVKGGMGGTGGQPVTASLHDGSVVKTEGDYLPAVNALSRGGAGGNGSGDSNGGAGGHGAAVQVYMDGAVAIETAGVQSHGVIARSYGGAGGGVGVSSGFIDFTREEAGTGGDGREVSIVTAPVNGVGGSITTSGDGSVGMLAQSLGGIGGSTSDSFQFIANPGTLGGNGGKSGLVSVDSRTRISTAGEASHGIVGQSLGGAGGVAGESSGIAAVGGEGGNGVGGGQVTITQYADLHTSGTRAIGVLGQAIGGGGGDGGSSSGVAVIGGTGGKGGDGGVSSTAVRDGALRTEGDHAHGLVSQAIGGGGGTGGAASAYSAGAGFSMALAVGGSGGVGGKGGTATADVTNASITTGRDGSVQEDAHGVVVQSIGGGGGAGGDSTAKALALAVPAGETSFAVAVSFALGGDAGDGSYGGSASAKLSDAEISTYGAHSQGVVVQSIGGGGGLGGSASASSTVVGTGESIGGTVQASLGGSGGTGANGGHASFDMSDSAITTRGRDANAVVLQSIGAGGGAGGIGSATGRSAQTGTNVSITAALGGTGGAGGAGGTVSLAMSPSSTVTTYGGGARAVLMQSIGAGGGASQGGQFGVDASGTVDQQSVDAHASISVGRGGGGGGSGGNLELNSDGDITTYGADADGLLAQSIGGSGGLGGAVGGVDAGAPSLPSLADEGTSYKLDLFIGGNGGAGGHGGRIGSDSAPAVLGATIQTHGDYADAVVLQSIGGGGGAGGVSTAPNSVSTAEVMLSVGGRTGQYGSGGHITTFLDGTDENGFNTEGYGAMGIVMQSVGGGGGLAATGSPRARGQLSVGGLGDQGQDGGNIRVGPVNGRASWAAIRTLGDSAHGMLLQSIGGGGGAALAGSTVGEANPGWLSLDLAAGSTSHVGGQGGQIDLDSGVRVKTAGDRAIGVIAQSIGSGGGVATAGSAANIRSIRLGTQSTSSGNGSGGAVRVSLRHEIKTQGAGAHGIVAQSIGAGGGIVGDTSKPIGFDRQGFGNSSTPSGSGSAGDVNVAFDGTLETAGDNAHGIVAQSIAGGGGLAGGPDGGFAGSMGAGGTAGNVFVSQTGTLNALGAGSVGIFAQSDAGKETDTGTTTVNVNGAVRGGSGNGSGIWIASAKTSQITIASGGALSAESGVALRHDAKDNASTASTLKLDNYGILQGDIVCGGAGATCNVINHEGAEASKARVYDANFRNAGRLVVGGPGQYDKLTVNGHLDLTESGVLRVHTDFANTRSSHVLVRGKASVAGSLEIVPESLMPHREVAVLTAEGGLENEPSVAAGPVVQYQARRNGEHVMVSATSADFATPVAGLDGNGIQVAGHLQHIWDKGGNAEMARLFADLDMAARQGGGAYRDSVSSLSPGASAAPAVQTAAGLGRFTGNMMSCPVFSGIGTLTEERDCFWGQAGGRWSEQDAHGGAPGFDFDTYTYQFGGQREVRPGWFVGGSVAYESSRMRGHHGRGRGDGDTGYLGVMLKRQSGPWVFSAALGAGYGSYSMERNISIPGYQQTLESKPDVYGANMRLRAARTFATGNMYVKPYVDLDATYTRMRGYTESGASPVGLSVDDSDKMLFGLSPMIEMGGRMDLKDGSTMRPYVYAGVSLLSDDEWETSSRLRGAPAGTSGFGTTLPFDDVVGKVGGGVHLTRKSGADFRLQYDGQFSSNAHSHGISLKMAVPF